MIRASFDIANRQPKPPTGALSLLQSRPQTLKVSPPRQRLEVAVDAETRAQLPQAVKIIHAG